MNNKNRVFFAAAGAMLLFINMFVYPSSEAFAPAQVHIQYAPEENLETVDISLYRKGPALDRHGRLHFIRLARYVRAHESGRPGRSNPCNS